MKPLRPEIMAVAAFVAKHPGTQISEVAAAFDINKTNAANWLNLLYVHKLVGRQLALIPGKRTTYWPETPLPPLELTVPPLKPLLALSPAQRKAVQRARQRSNFIAKSSPACKIPGCGAVEVRDQLCAHHLAIWARLNGTTA